MSKNQIQILKEQAFQQFQSADTVKGLYEAKVKFLGKKGSISLLMREMGKLSKEERPIFGQEVNNAKKELETVYSSRETELKENELEEKIRSEVLDLTLPGPPIAQGSCHPVTLVTNEIVQCV